MAFLAALRQLDDAPKNPSEMPVCAAKGRLYAEKAWRARTPTRWRKGDWEKRLAKVSKQAQYNH